MDEDVSNDDGWMDAGAEYSPKSEFSKPKVVEESVSRCVNLRAKEMKKGYYNTNFSKDGLPLKQWIEDSRKAYCSAVQALKALMMPEILTEKKESKAKNKDKKEVKSEIQKKLDKISECFKKYSYHILEGEVIDGKTKYKKTENTYMPDVDAVVKIREIYPDGNEKLKPINGYWNNMINAYWDNMVIINDELFEELIAVIHRLNYFKSKVRYG